jgi:hypothetical protein
MARTRSTARLAAQGAGPPVLDALDLDVLAESQVLSVLTTVQAQPMPEREVMRHADQADHAALRAALERLAGQGAVERIGAAEDESPSWRLTAMPAGHW